MNAVTVYQPEHLDAEIAKTEAQLAFARALLPKAIKTAEHIMETTAIEKRGLAEANVRMATAAAHRQELANLEYAQKIQHGASAPDVARLHQQLAAQQQQILEANRKLAEATKKLDEAQGRINRAFDQQGAKASKLDSLLRDDTL